MTRILFSFNYLDNQLFIFGACPKPHFIFCLDAKNEAKKVKTSPTSLKKLAFVRLNRPNLLKFVEYFMILKNCTTNFNFKQGRFLTPFSLIFWFTGRGHSLVSVCNTHNCRNID